MRPGHYPDESVMEVVLLLLLGLWVGTSALVLRMFRRAPLEPEQPGQPERTVGLVTDGVSGAPREPVAAFSPRNRHAKAPDWADNLRELPPGSRLPR